MEEGSPAAEIEGHKTIKKTHVNIHGDVWLHR